MLLECNHEKRYMSEDYKYTFNKLTGYFERWGKTEDDELDGENSRRNFDTVVVNGELK